MAPTTGIYSRLTGFRKVSQVLPVWGSTLCETQPAQWASLLGFAKSPIGQSASDRDTESPRNPPRFLRIESKNNEGHALQFTSKGRRFHKEPAPRRNGSCMAQSSRSIARHGRGCSAAAIPISENSRKRASATVRLRSSFFQRWRALGQVRLPGRSRHVPVLFKIAAKLLGSHVPCIPEPTVEIGEVRESGFARNHANWPVSLNQQHTSTSDAESDEIVAEVLSQMPQEKAMQRAGRKVAHRTQIRYANRLRETFVQQIQYAAQLRRLIRRREP
jgi:hypothetical protein